MTRKPPPRPALSPELLFEAIGLSPDKLKRCFREVASTEGLSIYFEEGSNPQFHIHVHSEDFTMGRKTTGKTESRSIAVGGNVEGSALQQGDQDTATVRYQQETG